MMKNNNSPNANDYLDAIDYLVNKSSVKENNHVNHVCFSPYFLEEYQKLVNDHNRRNIKR